MSDNDMYPEFVTIPAGEFFLGASPGNDEAHDDEKPRVRIYVDEFAMAKYPVTNEQYMTFIRETGHRKPDCWDNNYFNGLKQPVVGVSWHDARAYCAWLSQETGSIRLPTEAEWEKAARGGAESRYYWGDRVNGAYMWYENNSGRKTHPVGKKKPNDYGLYDMIGNAWEWVEDYFDKNWYKQLKSGERNPINENRGSSRVLRGGAYDSPACDLRVSYRRFDRRPTYSYHSRGFRCAQD